MNLIETSKNTRQVSCSELPEQPSRQWQRWHIRRPHMYQIHWQCWDPSTSIAESDKDSADKDSALILSSRHQSQTRNVTTWRSPSRCGPQLYLSTTANRHEMSQGLRVALPNDSVVLNSVGITSKRDISTEAYFSISEVFTWSFHNISMDFDAFDEA